MTNNSHMGRRFPSPFIGVPKHPSRYRTILSAFGDRDTDPVNWDDFLVTCKEQYRKPETGEVYSKSYLERVLLTCETFGVIDREEGLVEPSPPAKQWLNGKLTFEEFLWQSIKRSWVLLNEFPIGIEGLREVHNAVININDEFESGGVTSKEICNYLNTERDYEFNQNRIRGYPELLTQLGALIKQGDSYTPGDHSDTYKSRLTESDIFRQLEQRLRREGAGIEPPEDDVKRDLAKYYMYRESGGLGKENRWYRTFWEDYLNENSRRGESPEARMQKSEKYLEVQKDRETLFQKVLDKFGRYDSKDIQGLSADVLFRMKESNSFLEAQRIKIAAGSGITRLDLERLRDVDRAPYSFADTFDLYDWQRNAVERWFGEEPGVNESQRGIAQVVTGAGKTVMALGVIRRYLSEYPNGVVSVIVPTKVLMHQWLTELVTKLNIPVEEIGWAGGGHKDSFLDGRRVMVYIVNSAIKNDYLIQDLKDADEPPHLLIADECHRYTGDVFSNVFDAPRNASLGLSATPLSQTIHSPSSISDMKTSEEIDLTDDDKLLLQEIGAVFFTLTYDEGLDQGLIPGFSINYIGFDLSGPIRESYEEYSRDISDALKDIRDRHGYRLDTMGGDFYQNLQSLLHRDDVDTPQIAEYFQQTTARRELVSNAPTRQGITYYLLREALEDKEKTIVFQERIEQLEKLVAPLEKRQTERTNQYERYPGFKEADKRLEELFSRDEFKPVMYHSGHSRQLWNDFAMQWFRQGGFANTMFSVKALIEGVDVPSADVGIVRVSSSSVRQRIQTLGRILRSGEDSTKRSRLYVLYARDTVDESIFDKHDWSAELANAEVNHFIWESEGDSIDGSIRRARSDELPSRSGWEPPEIPDLSDLKPGDPYSGPRDGYRLKVDSEGRPFEYRKNARRLVVTEAIRDAAQYVREWKGGGTIIVNDVGHILTHLPEKGLVFLGFVDGGIEELEYGEDHGRLSDQAPNSLDEVF